MVFPRLRALEALDRGLLRETRQCKLTLSSVHGSWPCRCRTLTPVVVTTYHPPL